jgi:hypothetical protein
MGRIVAGIMSQDHVTLAPHGRRLYRWRREVSTAKEGRCDLRHTAGSPDIIADVDAVVADPEFYQQGEAYFRGIWAQAGEAPPGQPVLLQVLAPYANGLAQSTLQQRSGLDPATCVDVSLKRRAHAPLDRLWRCDNRRLDPGSTRQHISDTIHCTVILL